MAVGPTLEGLSAKQIVYYPRSGGSRTIEAIVEYLGPQQVAGLAGGSRPQMDVYVRNNSATGISSAQVDTGGDKLDVPLRYGKSAKKVRINEVIAQDKAMLKLRVY